MIIMSYKNWKEITDIELSEKTEYTESKEVKRRYFISIKKRFLFFKYRWKKLEYDSKDYAKQVFVNLYDTDPTTVNINWVSYIEIDMEI